MRWRRTTPCERAAQWISLDLDGDLTHLERAALARHLGRCEGCRKASVEIGGFTGLMREAPLATLSRPIVVAVPGRARLRATRRTGVLALTAAAAAAVVAGLTLLPRPTPLTQSALSFRTSQEQRRFAREHVRIEPVGFLVATPSPLSFASRALR